MAKKLAAESKTGIPELAPCFNCGFVGNFKYDPLKDNLPTGTTGGMKCTSCFVQGPGGKTIKEAMELWNNLYLMAQTAKVYNTLAKVSSPAEFAIWMQGLLEQVKSLDETKMTIAQKEQGERFARALREVLDNSVDAVRTTAEAFGMYTRTIQQIPSPPPETLTLGHWTIAGTPVIVSKKFPEKKP